ncbi:MAG: peptidase S24 [Bacteroidetes bacterium GWA2_30_7]|nr:MAG: peptidase S24 [Bacteroidetes bacterium GWA2_30_7]
MSALKISSTKTLDFYSLDTVSNIKIPFVSSEVSAGFPSPAEDFIDKAIDLNKIFIKNVDATFCARVKGNSMVNAGISDGDLIIIDRSLEPQDNKIAVCFIDGEFTVKRIKIEKDTIWLLAENESYKPIKVTKDNEFVIWGIVTTAIKLL